MKNCLSPFLNQECGLSGIIDLPALNFCGRRKYVQEISKKIIMAIRLHFYSFFWSLISPLQPEYAEQARPAPGLCKPSNLFL
jgi:hypothetical protein